MSKPSNIVVFNGHLLPDDAPVDYVLWDPERDFEVIELSMRPGSPQADSKPAVRHIPGWRMFVPDRG